MNEALVSFTRDAGAGIFYVCSLVVALPLSILVTLIFLALFRRRVAQLMRTSIVSPPEVVLADLPAPNATQQTSRLEFELIRATSGSPRTVVSAAIGGATRRPSLRLAAMYMIPGCALPLVLATVILVANPGLEQDRAFQSALNFVVLFLVNATPAFLACITVLKGELRYLLVAVLLQVVLLWALDGSVPFHAVRLWMLTSAIPTAAVLMLSTRRLRSVGPGIFAATILPVCGIGAGQLFAWRYVMQRIGLSWEDVLQFYRPFLRDIAGLAPVEKLERFREFIDEPMSFVKLEHPEALTHMLQLQFVGISLTSALLGVGAGWWLVRWLAQRYATRRASDMMVRIDALTIVFALSMSIAYGAVFGWVAAWVLGGFAAYWFLSRWILSRLRDTSPDRARPLLLLRVFGFDRRTQALLDDLQHWWRYLGTIHLIAGTDLAYTTVEPYEFLEFLGRRLDRSFVQGRDDLDRRLSEIETRPDPDGRYRIYDFFCYEHTWRMTVSALARQVADALMDLRGFTQANSGCIFEIEQLLATVDPGRIVVLVDDSTDLAFLKHTMQSAWRMGGDRQPPHQTIGRTIRIVEASVHRRDTIDTLMGVLCASA